MMTTNLIMGGITLCLAGLLLAGAKYRPDGGHFFDRENTGALRGFWCLIVVLVHVPAAYQNGLQDILGSFAYVGVTFFFMTSAYGLRLAAGKHPESIRHFWRNRLPKLLVPCVLSNAVHLAVYAAGGSRVSPWLLVEVGGWVRWLLVCYLIFWLCYRLTPEAWRDWAVCGLAAAFSLAVYVSKPTVTTWCPEVLGFAWGILLGRWKDRFTSRLNRGWPVKCAGLCLLSGVLGVGYLLGKQIPFWGDYLLKISLGAAILAFMLALNTKITIGNRVSRLLGDVSYEVYLLHDAAFFALATFLPGLNSGVFILLSLLFTAAVSLAVQRISTGILNFFTENRSCCKDRRTPMSQEKKLNGTVIVTYRCNARCSMCNRYKAPSRPEEEISIETIKKLPRMYFTNITGGEPFIRTDLKDIVRELYKKSDRIVISTNGFFTDRIVELCREFPQVGIRISIEGLEKTNNEIRGLPNGYQRGYQTLKQLREMGMKDVGFGMTVQDKNAPDLVPLYKISDEMGMEFATASLHNSFYFVEAKNIIHDRPMVAKNFEDLVNELLKSSSPKKWFRAYFNHGLINYIYGQKRLLPCDMSFDTFFIDPYGDVMPCNGTKDKEVMGNLNRQSWDELWSSPEAEAVRKKVRCCDRDCWMIGSVSPAMHKYIWVPAAWVIWHKCKALFMKKPYSMYENKICRDYRDGKVSKQELDACSTCDMHCQVNNGLSEQSMEQLKTKTGEEIVDADIAAQMGN